MLRWSLIAGRVPGRTDNQVKNYWNTHLRKKLGASKNTSPSHVSTTPKLSAMEASKSSVESNSKPHSSSSNGATQFKINEGTSNVLEVSDKPEPMIFESFWASGNYFELSTPGLMEFFDGCSFDCDWYGV